MHVFDEVCVEIHFEERDFRGIIDANLHRDNSFNSIVGGGWTFFFFFFIFFFFPLSPFIKVGLNAHHISDAQE